MMGLEFHAYQCSKPCSFIQIFSLFFSCDDLKDKYLQALNHRHLSCLSCSIRSHRLRQLALFSIHILPDKLTWTALQTSPVLIYWSPTTKLVLRSSQTRTMIPGEHHKAIISRKRLLLGLNRFTVMSPKYFSPTYSPPQYVAICSEQLRNTEYSIL